MAYFRSVFGKKQIKYLISAAVSLILLLILILICSNAAKKQTFQRAAERWGNSKEYSQVSVFLSELAGVTEDDVLRAGYSLNKKLTDDSLVTLLDKGRAFVQCYSAQGEVDICTASRKGNFRAYGVGGDFFLFHPYELVSGSYFPADSVNKDYVMLDKLAAWTLFGSYDIQGQTVEIGGRIHIVSGVFDSGKGKLNKLAGNDTSLVILSYSSLENFGTITFLNDYEVLMKNPLTNYAKDAVVSALGVDKTKYAAVENTRRFHWTKLLVSFYKQPLRSMNTTGVVCSYWENMARGLEELLTPFAILGVLLGVYPIIVVFVILIRMWKKRTIHREDIFDFAERRLEDWREKRNKERFKKGEDFL